MGEKLGQNFLVNKEIVKKIIESADLTADDLVLEIGPGKGILTEELAQKAGKVLAIELDTELCSMLRSKLRNNKNVEIIEGDILKLDLQSLFPLPSAAADTLSRRARGIRNNYKVVANIPYYITAPIIRKFLESDLPPSEMILMVQKEVAERICAHPSEIPAKSAGAKRISRGKPGQMSILAVAVQYYAEPEILFNVPRENFDPAPEVDSAVIRISHIAKRETQKEEVKNFFRVVRAGFSAKRKTLVNNLANSFHLDKKEAAEKIISVGLKPTTRAQELSVVDWKKLAELFS